MHHHLDRVVREFQRGVNDKPEVTEMRAEKRAVAAARKRGPRALAKV